MQVRKSDFVEWKNHPVTHAVAESIAQIVEVEMAYLIGRRSSKPEDDQWIKGFVNGVKALLDWEPDFIEEDNNDIET